MSKICEEIKSWRNNGFEGATNTSKDLQNYWFKTDHFTEQADKSQSELRYYFFQREAVETVIWLYDVRGVRDKYDLIRFDAYGAEKTKVLSLLIA